jgi:hypothetical protein
MSHRLALAAVALIALLAPATAAAKATPTEISTAKTKGVEYLKGLQKTNGEISGFGGDWALTAFAAAGVAPADVKKTGDARGWYEGLVGSPTWPGAEALATDFERGALLAYAAGIDPARVSKRQNLIAKVASYYQPEAPATTARPSTRPSSACWRWPMSKPPAGQCECPRSCSNRPRRRSRPTSTPTAAGLGKKPPATKKR